MILCHFPRCLFSFSRLDETAAILQAEVPGVKTKHLIIDLASLASCRAAAKEVRIRLHFFETFTDGPQVNAYNFKIDVLINNAAIMCSPEFNLSVDGLENQFAVNHVGPALFTVLIKPALAQGVRIVNVSSLAVRYSGVRFDDLSFGNGKNYVKWEAYGQSKSANALFTVSLAKKWTDIGATAFSLHPGIIPTKLADSISLEEKIRTGMFNADGSLGDLYTWKTIPQGAATTIVAAFDPAILASSGSYLSDCIVDNAAAAPHALDEVRLHLVASGRTFN